MAPQRAGPMIHLVGPRFMRPISQRRGMRCLADLVALLVMFEWHMLSAGVSVGARRGWFAYCVGGDDIVRGSGGMKVESQARSALGFASTSGLCVRRGEARAERWAPSEWTEGAGVLKNPLCKGMPPHKRDETRRGDGDGDGGS